MTVANHPPRPAIALTVLLAAWVACRPWVAQPPAQSLTLAPPQGLDRYVPVSEDNALSLAKVRLGRRLFFDSSLSATGTVACVSCHDPALAFTDGRAVPVGSHGRTGRRSAATLVNRAYGAAFFWDGRATSLEQQALMPIQAPNEMDTPIAHVLARVRASRSYVDAFNQAFGREPNTGDLARALASYVRTILSGDAPADRYAAGDRGALDARERAGRRLFMGRANCWRCHNGPLLSVEQFRNTGVAWRGGMLADSGRFAVTRRPQDLGAFKVPTLREIARTAPYMHDGSISTLAEVVDFYDRGGIPNPYLDGSIRPLHLTGDEKRALVAFLGAMSGCVQEGGRERCN